MQSALLNVKLLLILIFTSVFLFLFDYLNYLNFPKTLAQTITVPVQYGFYQSGMVIGRQFAFIPASRHASLENLAMKKQLGEILVENASIRKQLIEAQALVDQQNSLSLQTYDLKAAEVIGTGRNLLINKGSLDGVNTGQIIVFKDNYIGKIQQVDPKTAKIMMTQDPDSKIAVYSQAVTGRARGILLGQFGSDLLMDKILHQEAVSVGDLVYSEGTEGELPRGLIMGKVTEVLERENQVFKQAKVEPVINTGDLDVVFVMEGY